VKTSSPLRYPGGKSALAGLLAAVRRLNGLGSLALAEPFAGGAGASLTLLYAEEVPEIQINDADAAIGDFWWALIHRPNAFGRLIEETPLTIREWRRQRDLYRSRRASSRLRRGFAAFYLNRCNRSGIIMNGGPIGGVRQVGRWKLDARFNRSDLLQRCGKIAEYRDRIKVSGDDGLRVLAAADTSRTMFFVDPPYYAKGQTVYMNYLDHEYHVALAETLRRMRNVAWIVTYDDCPEVRSMYRGWTKIKPFVLKYTAAGRRTGSEVMIAPKWMRLPSAQTSLCVEW